jgi:hypothetical protein
MSASAPFKHAEAKALRKAALAFPKTVEDFPWGHSAFKVAGKKAFLFMGASVGDGLHPGKIQPDWEACRISYGGEVHRVSPYELLVPEDGWALFWTQVWAPEDPRSTPVTRGAVKAGAEVFDEEREYPFVRDPLYVCRVRRGGCPNSPFGHQLGKVRPGLRGCLYAYGDRSFRARTYEVLSARPRVQD